MQSTLIYLIPQKHADGSITVTIKPYKKRSIFNPISFKKNDSNRQVTQLAKPLDTIKANAVTTTMKKHEETIDWINAVLSNGLIIQKVFLCNVLNMTL